LLGIAFAGIADLPDPNGWWKLDEGSGAAASDSSGNGYDGTIYGTPGWGTDFLFENVLNFNGSANQVEEPEISIVNLYLLIINHPMDTITYGMSRPAGKGEIQGIIRTKRTWTGRIECMI
jgi:hypothetical protein